MAGFEVITEELIDSGRDRLQVAPGLGVLFSNAGLQAELSFSGVSVPHPIYDLLGWDGRRGLRLKQGYFGRLDLIVRTLGTETKLAELSQVVVNTSFVPTVDSIATWLPDEPFLIVRTDRGGRPQLFILGPVGPLFER